MSDVEQVIRTMLGDVIDGGRYELMGEVMADDYVDHTPMGDVSGRKAYAEFLEGFRAAMPGFHHTVSDITELGDGYVTFQVRFNGKFTGNFMGTDGAGQDIEVWVANAARLRDGKLVEHWGLGPEAAGEMMGQMGVAMPTG